MMGKNHLISNTCSLILLGSGVVALQSYTGVMQTPIHIATDALIQFVGQPQDNIMLVWQWWVCSFLLFLLGTLLPDIDSEKSILGRFIYVPIEHRTWTHAIWIPLIFFMVSIWNHIVFWLGFGYLLHLFWDNLSFGGVCFCYPITKYRGYSNGAKVKQKHIFKLYRVGKMSEYVLTGILVALTIIVIVLDIIYFGMLPGM